MQVVKRSGNLQPYDSTKITQAMAKAFKSAGLACDDVAMQSLLQKVEQSCGSEPLTVEGIQDKVEQALMAGGYYDVAKRYILYRQKRTELRIERQSLISLIGLPLLEPCLYEIQQDFLGTQYSLTSLTAKFSGFLKPGLSVKESLAALVKAAVELTSPQAPRWEYIAARLLKVQFELEFKEELERLGLSDFYDRIQYLAHEGLYGSYITENYSKDEIKEAHSFIDESRDKLFTYAGLELLLKRYVICSRQGRRPLESPQEMFLGIALHLAMNEKSDRLMWVRKFYDMISNLQVTMATPTMSNARRPWHQLSSCFVDAVEDSLDGIYRSIDNFAKVSKVGGGMGLYFGKVRATGSAIRGFEGAAGGVIRWIKLVNDTAVAVDQLGMRQGAAAVYLDAWHKDLPEFLQLRTNNGDDRMKAHDIFPAVCYPDLFWKMAETDLNQSWHLMCPHEILSVKGYALEDYYGEEWERRYKDCIKDPRISKRVVPLKEIVRLIIKSAVETGTPFAFNRDTVNKANPNGHCGMIYSSNLCTEIAQNMAPIHCISTEVKTSDGDTVVVSTTRPGEFVVCNLASLVLGNIKVEDEEYLHDLVATVVRALDNVIDLNLYPLPYAQITNRRYRSLGLGVSGYHHLLARKGIEWESDAHLEFADKLFESINYAAISASSDLAALKGRYDLFEGSDWDTGEYFKKRGYESERWQKLQAKVKEQGMRNGYLIAVAPTASTGIIAGTTAGIDPIMQKFFYEEKKGTMLPRVAPQLSLATIRYYKGAHAIDQSYSVRACGIRQRHVDQAQSMNLYITNDFTMRQLLQLYLLAWRTGVKTLYYTRSKSLEVESCEVCAA